MTTELDDDLVPETLALIIEFGLPATFTVDAGTFDKTTSTWTRVPVTAVVNVTPPAAKSRLVEGVLSEMTISYVAAKDLTFVPVIGTLVTIDGRDFRITRSNAIYSGTLVCIYEMGLDE